LKGNKKNILIWLLTWAVLFLVIIYSPIGSPELYRPIDYMVYNQSVNFNGGIANAPKVNNYQQNEEPDLTIPTYTSAPKTYTVNASSVTSRTSGQTSYSVLAPANNRTATNQSSGGTFSTGGFTFIASGNKGTQETPAPQTTNISSLSTDLALVQDPTRQSVGYAGGTGGTDPGGDPAGPPIPVGDGFWVLLLMAGGYALNILITRIKENINYTN